MTTVAEAEPGSDERTPLLIKPPPQFSTNGAAVPSATSTEPSTDDPDKPLPKLQIAILSYARTAEPLVFFSIFPFINQMIRDTANIPEEDVGFYSGLIESLFSLTQIMFMIQWGRASDRFGRKPILIISLTGLAITGTCFGLATTIWQMILFRCLAGVFSGTIVTVRVLFTEHSTKKTEARAFSFFAFAGNVSIFAGPFIGGLLSTPATQYPGLFGNIRLFKEFPYFLPCLVTGCFSFSAMLLALFFLEEPKRREKQMQTGEPPSTWAVLKSPGVPMTFWLLSLTSILGLGFTAIAPLWWFTPVPLGGLGFTPAQISIFLGTIGLSQALWLLLVFPPLTKRIGTGGVLRLCSFLWPIFFMVMPLLVVLRASQYQTAFWIGGITFNMIGGGVSMAFTAIQLVINAVAPPDALGTLNGLTLAYMAALRAICPAAFSSFFATGVRNHILWGQLIFIPLIALGVILRTSLFWLPLQVDAKENESKITTAAATSSEEAESTSADV